MSSRPQTNRKVAVLATGNGSITEAIVHAHEAGQIDVDVSLVVCNKPEGKAGIYEKMAYLNELYGRNIAVEYVSEETHPGGKIGPGQTLDEARAIYRLIQQHECSVVLLIGYLKIVRGVLIERMGWSEDMKSIYEGSMLNLHPAPLPETRGEYGPRASQLVLDLGLKASKHVVHLAAADVDAGPIVGETEVEILPGDSAKDLNKRVHATEIVRVPFIIDQFLTDREEYFSQMRR